MPLCLTWTLEASVGAADSSRQEQVGSLLPCSLQDRFEDIVRDIVRVLYNDQNEVSLRCQSQASRLSHSPLLSLNFGAAVVYTALLSGGG